MFRSLLISAGRGGANAKAKFGAADDTKGTVVLRQRVYDPILRAIHGWNAVCVLGLIATAEVPALMMQLIGDAQLWRTHLWLGYGLAFGLSARLIWGFAGPVHARWKDLWHPDQWRSALRSGRWFAAPRRFGHHPLASAAYLMLYAALMTMMITGLGLAALEQNQGPLTPWLNYRVAYQWLVKAPHELLSWAVLIYVPIHLLALVVHTKRDRVPIVQSMITGYQYLRKGI